jgi:hypothetical protein
VAIEKELDRPENRCYVPHNKLTNRRHQDARSWLGHPSGRENFLRVCTGAIHFSNHNRARRTNPIFCKTRNFSLENFCPDGLPSTTKIPSEPGKYLYFQQKYGRDQKSRFSAPVSHVFSTLENQVFKSRVPELLYSGSQAIDNAQII